jgi:HSP20 family protein
MKLFKNKNTIVPKVSGVIEKFFGGPGREEENSNIPVNISADSKNFDISLAVPGLDKKDLKVEVQGNNLVIKCEKELTDEINETDYFRKEYSFSSFQRIFEIPKGADTNNIKAKLKNGILKINMPRLKDFKETAKMIEVN